MSADKNDRPLCSASGAQKMPIQTLLYDWAPVEQTLFDLPRRHVQEGKHQRASVDLARGERDGPEQVPVARVSDRRSGTGHLDKGVCKVLATRHHDGPALSQRRADRVRASVRLVPRESRGHMKAVQLGLKAPGGNPTIR